MIVRLFVRLRHTDHRLPCTPATGVPLAVQTVAFRRHSKGSSLTSSKFSYKRKFSRLSMHIRAQIRSVIYVNVNENLSQVLTNI